MRGGSRGLPSKPKCATLSSPGSPGPVSQPQGTEPQRGSPSGEGERRPRSLLTRRSHPATCYPPGPGFPETRLGNAPLPHLGGMGSRGCVRGQRGREALQGTTEHSRPPLACPRPCSPAPPPAPSSLCLPGRRRWLKITPRPPALQRAARAAKGEDNVLAALIGSAVATL